MGYRHLVTFLLFVVLATLSDSSKVMRKEGTANLVSKAVGIYKGNTTTIEKHPYLVVVTWRDHFHCAGTIIEDNWVFLSGDCVDERVPSDLAVVVGSQDGVSGRKYNAVKIVIHPYYSSFDYDYALLQVEGKFQWSEKVKQASLPVVPAKAGTKMTIAGWGETSDYELQEGTMKALSLRKCKSLYSGYAVHFTERIGCVYNKGKTSPCGGDWSDPVVVDDVVHYIFIAIAKQGECTSDALPAVCALVYPAVPWIQNVTSEV